MFLLTFIYNLFPQEDRCASSLHPVPLSNMLIGGESSPTYRQSVSHILAHSPSLSVNEAPETKLPPKIPHEAPHLQHGPEERTYRTLGGQTNPITPYISL